MAIFKFNYEHRGTSFFFNALFTSVTFAIILVFNDQLDKYLEQQKYFSDLAYKDFVSMLTENKEIKQTVLHEKKETISKNINIPKKAIASYGKSPTQGTKPSKLVLKNK